MRLSHTETVESGKARISAISAAVMCSLLSASIARTRSSESRVGVRLGREERSRSS
jgi:hypothetical protein